MGTVSVKSLLSLLLVVTIDCHMKKKGNGSVLQIGLKSLSIISLLSVDIKQSTIILKKGYGV